MDGGITLLPANCFDSDCEVELLMDQQSTYRLRMPPSFCTASWRTSVGNFSFCVQTEDVAPVGLLGARCKVLTLRPKVMVTNLSSDDVEFHFTRVEKHGSLLSRVAALPRRDGAAASTERLSLGEGDIFRLAAGQSRDCHFDVEGIGSNDITSMVRLWFRPAGDVAGTWSGPFSCDEGAAGTSSWLRPGTGQGSSLEVWSVGIVPSRGTVAVSFGRGSNFVAANRVSGAMPVTMAIRIAGLEDRQASVDIPVLAGGQEVPFGWLSPASGKQGFGVEVVINGTVYAVPDVRHSMRFSVKCSVGSFLVSVARIGEKTLLALEKDRGHIARGSTLQVDFKLSQFGISLMQEKPEPNELIFVSLDVIRLQYHQSSVVDAEQIRFFISDVQVACQLPSRKDEDLDGSKGRKDPRNMLFVKHKAVLLSKQTESDDFLDIILKREASSSQDMILSGAKIAISGLDVSVDEGWFVPLMQILEELGGDAAEGLGIPYQEVTMTAGRPFVEGYTLPPMPSVLQIEALRISALDLKIWCSLPIRCLDFLPAWVRTALRMMCLGGRFTLEGASLKLPAKELPSTRGSAEDLAEGFASEYSLAVLRNVAGLLGKSSLVNLPAAPIKIGGAAVALVTDGIGGIAGEAAARLGGLAFDDEYSARCRESREQKQIQHAGDAVFEAGRSLARGADGILDIVRKPVAGAKNDGLKGFAVGVGQGVAGAVVKPIAGVGTAVSDIGAGIAVTAQMAAPALSRNKGATRVRQPRLLFDELREVRPFSEVGAEVLRQLGQEFVHGVNELVLVARQGPSCAVLLLFSHKVVAAKIDLPAAEPHDQGAAASGCGSSSGDSCAAASPGSLFENIGHAFKPVLSGQARELVFSDLAEACFERELVVLTLKDHSGTKHTIPLGCASLGESAIQALVDGLRAAVLHPQHRASWCGLHARLCEEQMKGGSSNGSSSATFEQSIEYDQASGQRTLEVIEVQRWSVIARSWAASSLPTDVELSWRWVNARGRRHPNIPPGLSRRECATHDKCPPCELDQHFKPISEWEVRVNASTDQYGWVYSPTWSASHWRATRSPADQVRKRLWIRRYS